MDYHSKRPLVGVTFVFSLGIILAFIVPTIYWVLSSALFGIFLGFWFCCLQRKAFFHFIPFVFYVAVLFGGMALTHLRNHSFNPHAIHCITNAESREVKLKGRIATMPLQFSESKTIQCALDVKEISSFIVTNAQKTSGLVWAKLYQENLDKPLMIGDQIEATGFLQAPFIALNPGQFDQSHYLAQKNIYRIFISHSNGTKKISTSSWAWLQQKGQQFRYYMNRALKAGLEEDPKISSILAGMLYGDRTAFTETLNEKFRRTGTLHLFAVSGQNVALLAGIGLIGLRLAGFLRWRWGWFLIPFLIIYTLATGSQPSAIRACVMASFFLLAWVLDRPIDLLQLMCGAAFVILLVDPNQLRDVGFQFSFTVVFALILIAPKLFARLKKIGAPDEFLPRQLWPKWYEGREAFRIFIWGTVAASVAAFIGATPLTAYYFNLWVPISLIVNVVVVLFATGIVFIATLSVALFWLLPSLAVLCNNANWLMAKLLLSVILGAAQVPGGARYIAWPWNKTNKPETQFTVLSVGEGQACLLQSKTKTELWDVSGQDQFSFVVGPFLKSKGINTLDRVWLSQGVENHVGGALLLRPSWNVYTFLKAKIHNQSSTLRKIDRLFSPQKIQLVQAPYTVHEKDYQWQILYPIQTTTSSMAQDKPLVARLRFPACSILLAGDISKTVEKELIKKGNLLESDILIQGRHSREENLSEDFLDAVKPKHLLFHGGGYWNVRLTPVQRHRLEQRQIKIWSLEKTGAVTITPTQNSFQLKSFVYSN